MLVTYNPQTVTVLVVAPAIVLPAVLGVVQDIPDDAKKSPIIDGFAKGSFVTAERAQPTSRMIPGCDGEVARTLGFVRMGGITITLDDYSPSNESLSLLAMQDEATGTGVASVGIYDRASRFGLAFGLNASLEVIPPFGRGDRVGTVSWRFQATRVRILHSGGRR